MSAYYALVCDACRLKIDSVRKGESITPMTNNPEPIYQFLYAHAHHALRNLPEHSDEYTDYSEFKPTPERN